jgi:hypothetical protein
MKIVINSDYGGFSLSNEAIMMYSDVKKLNLKMVEDDAYSALGITHFYIDGIISDEHYFTDYSIPRNDKELVAIVEALKERADGKYAKLKIVEIPDDVNWYIEEYDGNEWVAERHRTWT